MRQSITLLLFLVAAQSAVFAQQSLPSAFKHEIGLNLGNWINKDPGLTLVWKRQLGVSYPNAWQHRSAFRLVGGFYNDKFSSEGLPYTLGDSTYQDFTKDPHKQYYFLYAGLEQQYAKGHWRWYFGMDLGYQYARSMTEVERRVIVESTGETAYSTYRESRIRSNTVRVAGFGGVQYYFGPHWSIGTEIGLNVGVEFSTVETLRNGDVVLKYKSTTLESNAHFYPSLTVSYHFGEPAVESLK